MDRNGTRFFVYALFIFGTFACAGRQTVDNRHSCRVGMTKQIAAVVVDCDAPIDELVALGRYDNVERVIGTDFEQEHSCNGTQGRILWLVNFNHIMTTRDAWRHMEEGGLRPATLPELLALGIMHRNLQLQFAIVALGSYSREDLGFPALTEVDGRRVLTVPFRFVWDEDIRFLAVRSADR